MIRRAIAWWLTAPIDMQAAVALIVVPWLLLAVLLSILPPPHH